jgi:hypothetical protein
MPLTKDLHLRLPEEVYERIEREAERTLVPVSTLARQCVLLKYGGDPTFVPADYMNPVVTTRNIESDSE